ncbi:LysR family transcriptional regulator [Antricoccus suffuscus]|uniref:LysR family transcriptional regulator n=1 Tax=Antricoccus suffuscus TaxID=1629062 RepID=A0A2T1A5V2_9ACTN|nr:LysR substrate-binding domain-containing protein [Antricoccus suffuscus]PRZ43944.1 LysR family transcriptional regulator [Antricoccus suffuscus]
MELRHLVAFVAVAEELSFRKAAERLQVSQPPLSQQIKRLERDVGARLLDRDTRRVELTAAGSAFLIEANRALDAARAAKMRARQAAQGDIGSIDLGFNGPGNSHALIHLTQRVRTRLPGVAIELVGPYYSGEIVDLLRRRRIDCGFVRLPIDLHDLQVLEVARDQLYLAVPADHRLANRDEVSIEDIADEAVVSVPHDRGSAAAVAIDNAYLAHGVTARLKRIAPDMHTLMLLVASGVGSGFILGTAAHLMLPGVKLIRVPDIPPIPLLIAWHAENTNPTLARVIDLIDGSIGTPLQTDPASLSYQSE